MDVQRYEKGLEIAKEKEVENRRYHKEVEKKEEVAPSPEDLVIEGANYLAQIVDITFKKAYEFAKKNEGISKQTLLEKYINEL